MRVLVLAILFVLMLPLNAAADILPDPWRPPPPPPSRPNPPRVSYVEQETDWNGLMGAGVFIAIIVLVVADDRRRGGGDIEL